MRKILSLLMILMVVLSLCACQKEEIDNTIATTHETETTLVNTIMEAEETTIPATTESTEIEIEISSENFGEYFEVFYEYDFQVNSFGDISNEIVSWGIHLKEPFQPYLKKAESISVELAYFYGYVNFEPNYTNKTIVLKDITSTDIFEVSNVYDLTYDDETTDVGYKVPGILMVKPGEQIVRCPVDLKVYRAIGTLILTEYPDTVQSDNNMPSATKKSNETEEITISTENWNTYFEFVEVPVFSENPFGEVDTFNLYFQFRLKEEYLDRLNSENSNIAIEASYTYGHRYCTVDYETQTYELHEYQNTGKSSNMGELFSHSDGGYYFADFGVNPEYNGSTVFAYSDFEVLRIAGILCLSSD